MIISAKFDKKELFCLKLKKIIYFCGKSYVIVEIPLAGILSIKEKKKRDYKLDRDFTSVDILNKPQGANNGYWVMRSKNYNGEVGKYRKFI